LDALIGRREIVGVSKGVGTRAGIIISCEVNGRSVRGNSDRGSLQIELWDIATSESGQSFKNSKVGCLGFTSCDGMKQEGLKE
jgi:hypothetical protein